MLELKMSVDEYSSKMKEVAIALVLFIVVLLPFLIGLNQEIYYGDESLHISRGIRGISLIVHGDIGGDEWGYYYTTEGKVIRGAITPANVIMGFGPWLIGVRSGGWDFDVNPPDHVLVSARAVVAILGAVTCVILFYLGRALGGFRSGLFASFFLAFNPLWLMSSRQAMRDTPSAFFSAISIFLFYYGIKRKKFKAKASLLGLSGVTVGLALGSKPLAGVTWMTILICLLLMFINECDINRILRLRRSCRDALLVVFIFVTLSLLAYVVSIPYVWTDAYQRLPSQFRGGMFEFGAAIESSRAGSFMIPRDMLAATTGIMNFVLWPTYRPTSLRHFPTCLTWFNSQYPCLPCYSTLPATIFFFAGLAYLTLKVAKKRLSQIETLTLIWFVIALVGLSWWIPYFFARYTLQLILPIALIEATGLSYFLQKVSRKLGYFLAGATLATHAGSTLISFPEYSLFRLQSLFAENIGLMLTTAFILCLFCITTPRIRSILKRATLSQATKSVGGEKLEKI